jgi:phage portal protein BeeE
MNSTLDAALGAANRRAAGLVERALKAPPSSGPRASGTTLGAPAPTPSALAGGTGAASPLGALQRPQTTLHALEQYRHFAGWVYACIRPIAQRIAGQNMRVARVPIKGGAGYGRGQADLSQRRRAGLIKATVPLSLKDFVTEDAEVLDQHPLLDALNDPNAVMVRWALLYVTVASLELTGRAFWWILPRTAGERGMAAGWEIWPVPTSWVQPVHGDQRLYQAWKIQPDTASEAVEVPADQIAYIYYPDPSNPLGAVSPLQATARAVVADESIQDAQRRSFGSMNPGWLLTIGRHPDTISGGPGQRPILTQDQRRQIIATIKAFYQGVVKWDEPLILDGLIESAVRANMTVREMDFLASGKITKERISQVFGVNPIIMGQVEGANRASSATADDHFCSTTVNPKIELISQCLTAWVGPVFARPGERLLLYLEPAKAFDPEFELDRMKALSDRGGLAVNEFRASLGLPPIQGGDVCFVNGQLTPYLIIREDEPDLGYNPFLESPPGDANDGAGSEDPPPAAQEGQDPPSPPNSGGDQGGGDA